MMRYAAFLLVALFLSSCEYEEVEREIGYKGKARANPWLAAERFVTRTGSETRPVIAWTAPEQEDSVWIMPASILGNESFTRRMETWVGSGGHLILLVEHADSEASDWSTYAMPPDLKPALFHMLAKMGIRLDQKPAARATVSSGNVCFDGRNYKVNAKSFVSVTWDGNTDDSGIFATREFAAGRITVITDGRIFRNRWISDHQHADLLEALVDATDEVGRVGFMRGAGLSLWDLMKDYLPHFMLGFLMWMLLWVWKNISRFGPLESAAPPQIQRGYQHHLEALGGFQWRLDHGSSLLAPLREMVIELGQRTSARTGHRDGDFFQFLADRVGLPRERVYRALTEERPADSVILTRTTADLQQLLKVLHSNSRT